MTKKQEIIHWCKKMNIKNYSLREDLTIDVSENVNLSNKELKALPYKFGIVQGHFICSKNELLSLNNAPDKVTKIFDCSKNKLTSLNNAPKQVGDIYCDNNKITNFQDCEITFESHFFARDNPLNIENLGIDKISGSIMGLFIISYDKNNPIKEFERYIYNTIDNEKEWAMKIEVMQSYYLKHKLDNQLSEKIKSKSRKI